MKSKLSFRKKVIIEILSPTIVTFIMGMIRVRGWDSIITDIILFTAVVFFLFMLINTYRRNFEPEDEMAKRNQERADSLAFNITLISAAGVMLFAVAAKTSIVLSATLLLFGFSAMNLLNLAIFLYLDIRGN